MTFWSSRRPSLPCNWPVFHRSYRSPAHPIVASVSNDHEVQGLVDAGAISFQLDARELEAD